MRLKNKGSASSDNVRKIMARKINPFEVHINRSKHHVLGQKLKNDRGLPGVSKTKGLMKRKKTLLQEYKIRGKSNQFNDERIGERNKYMTEDDRIMARFVAERMCFLKKKSMFNLSSTEVLTHKGQILSEIERFDDTRSDDEEDNECRKSSGALKIKFVEGAHFGGGMLRTTKQDRESLIDQLINESKKRKAERQQSREETLEATNQLDEEWKSLQEIVTSSIQTEVVYGQKKDQYDIVMHQLKFEPYGRPSQKLKTDEEVAKEFQKQLEKLEKGKLKQQREEEFNKYGFHKSADDLDNGVSNFAVDMTKNDHATSDTNDESSNKDEEGSKYSSDVDAIRAKEEDKDEEVDGEGEKDNEPVTKRKCVEYVDDNVFYELITERETSENVEENGKLFVRNNKEPTEEESLYDESVMGNFTDLMLSLNYESVPSTTGEKKSLQLNGSALTEGQRFSKVVFHEELDFPYVCNIPDSYKSFRNFLKNRSVKQQSVIFERLLKFNHPTLEAGNKEKMLTLARYIVEIVSNENITWESLPLFVSQFNLLKEFNKEECIKMMVESLSTKLEDLTRDILPVQGVKHLTWYILVCLHSQGMDVLVALSRPALNLACSLVTRTHNVTQGLLCCYLLLQDARNSSTVYPEAISYLNTCVTTISKESCAEQQQKDNIEFKNTNNTDKASEDFKIHLQLENNVKDQKVLHCSVVLLSEFVKVYRKYPQSKLMFKPTHDSVCNLKVEIYPQSLKKEICELQSLLKVLSSVQLPFLAKNANKPKVKALRQYEPSFHTVAVGKSKKGLPEEQKLLRKYKQEMKGAMRELRQDRVFLTNVKLKEKALSDEQRKKKLKEIFSSAAAQQGELQSLKWKK